MFFLKQGQCDFVLPNFDNTAYIKIKEGQYFGMEDITAGIDKLDDPENWIQFKSRFTR